MIYKEISGRLGNQMFQYAFVRLLYEKSKNKPKIFLNFKNKVYNKGFENELKYFKVLDYKEVLNINLKFIQKLLLFLLELSEKFITLYCLILKKDNMEVLKYNYECFWARFFSKKGIYFMRTGFYKYSNFDYNSKYALGYFESNKYFDEIRDILLKEFTPKKAPLNKNKKLYKFINNNESICVTIRRGDFVNNNDIKRDHYLCTKKYFENSIKIIKKYVKNPKFVIFSDDINWCKKNIKIQGEVMYETGDDPTWEKLRLMYSCKHFIISNSTFSWWAQYLSRNDDKVVIAPNRWRNSGYYQDIYMDNWLLYDIDNDCLVGDNDGKN